MKTKHIFKKSMSLMLSLIIALSCLPAGSLLSFAKAADAYATVFTASDFQSGTCYDNLTAMMNSAIADGITATPDAFIFGGDYTAGSEDPEIQVPKYRKPFLLFIPDMMRKILSIHRATTTLQTAFSLPQAIMSLMTSLFTQLMKIISSQGRQVHQATVKLFRHLLRLLP